MEEDFDVFAFAGQSNADEHFFRRDGDTGVPLGREVFQQEILDQTGFQTDVLNVSGPGSASNNNVVTPLQQALTFGGIWTQTHRAHFLFRPLMILMMP